jgi:antitoxin (DNA-binding transcriptional repressor) of toxin-antitoxin stability system
MAILVTMRRNERTVPAAEFKAKCLALSDEVENQGHSFVVTKRGRAVARIVPLTARGLTSLRGSLLYENDLMSPVEVQWDSDT